MRGFKKKKVVQYIVVKDNGVRLLNKFNKKVDALLAKQQKERLTGEKYHVIAYIGGWKYVNV